MNNTEELSELHLQGKLQGEALQEWLAHLERNPDLQAAHLAKQRVVALLELAEEARLKALLQQAAAQPSGATVSFASWQRYSLAALLLFLLCFSVYYVYQTRQSDYLRFDMADYGISNTMSDISPSQKLLQEAMYAYQEAQYQEALQQFEHLSAIEASDTVVYYKALSQFRLKQYPEALQGFEELAKKAQSPYQSKAAYRQALSLLLLGRKEEAKPILQHLKAEEGHIYQEEIAALCEMLHL